MSGVLFDLQYLSKSMTLIYRVDRRAVGIIFAIWFQVLFLGLNTGRSAKMMTKGESGRSDCYVLRLSALLCHCFFSFLSSANSSRQFSNTLQYHFIFFPTLLCFVASISRSRLFGIKRKAAGK